MEILDMAMGKIHQSDILNIGIGGDAYVNVIYTDEVGKVLFVCFSPGFCFDLWRRWNWGGGVGLRLCVLFLWEVVVVVAVVCQGTISR
jgi:hypothetical protein